VKPAVLAIDGGNSKTDVSLVGNDGRLLASVRGGGSNYQTVGYQQMVTVLNELVADAAAAAGLTPGNATTLASHTSACLAGADLPEEEADLLAMVQRQGWSDTSSVVNDTYAVLRAGLPDGGEHWGIGVVCGAGTNCVGVAPDGRTVRFPALGEISGDWGGGGDLGRESLWWAVRAADGRGPRTALQAAVTEHFGQPDIEDVVAGLHFGRLRHADLHGMVPVLFALARDGDEVARDLVLRQATEIVAMVSAVARRLDLTGEPEVPVILGGSLMTARDPLLTEAISTRFGEALPGAWLRIVDVPPVTGAALLGLDHVAAPAEAAGRLRAESGVQQHAQVRLAKAPGPWRARRS
jgi:N-acetylglucosamine kinase-like BadF-type ATPase